MVGEPTSEKHVTWLIVMLLRGVLRTQPTFSADQLAVRDGIAAAVIVLLVAFQATTGTVMEYSWMFAGTALGLVFAGRHPLAR